MSEDVISSLIEVTACDEIDESCVSICTSEVHDVFCNGSDDETVLLISDVEAVAGVDVVVGVDVNVDEEIEVEEDMDVDFEVEVEVEVDVGVMDELKKRSVTVSDNPTGASASRTNRPARDRRMVDPKQV